MSTWINSDNFSAKKEAPYLCSPWGFSSLVRTFLSLVLWAAGSHFSCFTQLRTDPQVSLQNTEAMWTGEVYRTARLLRDLPAHTHIYTHSTLLLLLMMMMMGGKFDPACSASLLSPLCVASMWHFWTEFSRSVGEIRPFETLNFNGFLLLFLCAPMQSDPTVKYTLVSAVSTTFEWHRMTTIMMQTTKNMSEMYERFFFLSVNLQDSLFF